MEVLVCQSGDAASSVPVVPSSWYMLIMFLYCDVESPLAFKASPERPISSPAPAGAFVISHFICMVPPLFWTIEGVTLAEILTCPERAARSWSNIWMRSCISFWRQAMVAFEPHVSERFADCAETITGEMSKARPARANAIFYTWI